MSLAWQFIRKYQNYSLSRNLVVQWIRHWTANIMISKKPSSKGLEDRKFCAKLHQPHNSSGSSKINISTRTSYTSKDLKGFVFQWVRHPSTQQSKIQQLESTMFHDHHIAEEVCGNYFQTLSREDRNKEKMHSKEFKIQWNSGHAQSICAQLSLGQKWKTENTEMKRSFIQLMS